MADEFIRHSALNALAYLTYRGDVAPRRSAVLNNKRHRNSGRSSADPDVVSYGVSVDPLGLYRPSNPAAATSAKVGRNDPCPCGSGRKYKDAIFRKRHLS
jgi:hypothetical protein